MFFDVIPQRFRCGIGRVSKNRRSAPSDRLLFVEKTTIDEAGSQPPKSRSHRQSNPQHVGIERRAGAHAHLAQPPRQLRSGQIVGGGKCCLELGSAPRLNDLIQRGLGRGPQLAQAELAEAKS